MVEDDKKIQSLNTITYLKSIISLKSFLVSFEYKYQEDSVEFMKQNLKIKSSERKESSNRLSFDESAKFISRVSILKDEANYFIQDNIVTSVF